MNYLIPTLFILPFVAAIIVFFAGKISDFWRDFLACLFVAAETAICVYCFFVTPELSFEINDVFLLKLSFKLDGFRLLYTFVAVFMWFVTTFFSHEYFKNYTEKNRYYAFMLLTLGATVGLFMSDDLLTAFIFLEIMSFTSYVLVIHERTEKAISAAKTYITIAITGGLVMLMGLFLLYNAFGSLSFDALYANAG
ncbi:MAG: proton-conducting transporter membrane subunit, partial [Clostridia bacterium]